MLIIFSIKAINLENFVQTRYNNNVVYQIDQNPIFDLFKVQDFKFEVWDSQQLTIYALPYV